MVRASSAPPPASSVPPAVADFLRKGCAGCRRERSVPAPVLTVTWLPTPGQLQRLRAAKGWRPSRRPPAGRQRSHPAATLAGKLTSSHWIGAARRSRGRRSSGPGSGAPPAPAYCSPSTTARLADPVMAKERGSGMPELSTSPVLAMPAVSRTVRVSWLAEGGIAGGQAAQAVRGEKREQQRDGEGRGPRSAVHAGFLEKREGGGRMIPELSSPGAAAAPSSSPPYRRPEMETPGRGAGRAARGLLALHP